MKRRCPKCGSDDTTEYDDLGFIQCYTCGYDELTPEPLPYDVKKSQREKARFTPYKTGGSRRTIKK